MRDIIFDLYLYPDADDCEKKEMNYFVFCLF